MAKDKKEFSSFVQQTTYKFSNKQKTINKRTRQEIFAILNIQDRTTFSTQNSKPSWSICLCRQATEHHEEKHLQHTQNANIQNTVNNEEMNGIDAIRIDRGNFYFRFHETRVLLLRIKKCRLTWKKTIWVILSWPNVLFAKAFTLRFLFYDLLRTIKLCPSITVVYKN